MQELTLISLLEKVEPSEIEPGIRLYPCSAQLMDSRELDRVYFISLETSRRLFGHVSPDDVPDLPRISLDQVVSIRESPWRLPARFANEIYRAGESHYGCYIFTLVFPWGYRRAYLVGGFVDFLEFPGRYRPSEIKTVILHRGASQPSPVPRCKWCIFNRG
jgi:hypothetical protein